MSRAEDLARLPSPWDLVVVGGGVSGAAVFSLACARGYQCLLLEANDFAWGASSRSSKLVHGGLRYMRQGQFVTTWHSVRERQQLLKRYPGLIRPLGLLFPLPRSSRLDRALMSTALTIYDLMAGRRDHAYHAPRDFAWLAPQVAIRGAVEGFSFHDAVTDDARLVLRLIQEGRRRGGLALNYLEAADLLTGADGRVAGVAARDRLGPGRWEIAARVVVNATGPWCDRLRIGLGAPPRLRPLKGSHLLFPHWRFPLAQGVCFASAADRRIIFALPWQGMTLVGTTDLDCQLNLDQDPAISPEEGDYLLAALERWFPALGLTAVDVSATCAGVRPVVGRAGEGAPSCQSREHALWLEKGLISLAGGKLTTFGLMARQVLKAVGRQAAPSGRAGAAVSAAHAPLQDGLTKGVSRATLARIVNRYGPAAPEVLAVLRERGPDTVPGADAPWAELVWAAQRERVEHLDDLLLRRTRLGLILPDGGTALLDEVWRRVGSDLGWDALRWEQERTRYLDLWERAHSPRLLGDTRTKTSAKTGSA